MTSLVIGIAIGLVFGMLLILMSIPLGNTDDNLDYDKPDALSEQINDTGFIEIDIGKLSASDRIEETDSVYRLKRKLARFKLKNRFYN
jgi:hypothetical protein